MPTWFLRTRRAQGPKVVSLAIRFGRALLRARRWEVPEGERGAMECAGADAGAMRRARAKSGQGEVRDLATRPDRGGRKAYPSGNDGFRLCSAPGFGALGARKRRDRPQHVQTCQRPGHFQDLISSSDVFERSADTCRPYSTGIHNSISQRFGPTCSIHILFSVVNVLTVGLLLHAMRMAMPERVFCMHSFF